MSFCPACGGPGGQHGRYCISKTGGFDDASVRAIYLEELQPFLRQIPTFSALDLFCNRCGLVMRPKYGYNMLTATFYILTRCHDKESVVLFSYADVMDPRDLPVSIFNKAEILRAIHAPLKQL